MPPHPWARVGQRLRDFRGNVATIVAIAGTDVLMSCSGWPQWSVGIDDLAGFIRDGLWHVVVDAPTGPGACTKCGAVSEYQSSPYCCWPCSNGWR